MLHDEVQLPSIIYFPFVLIGSCEHGTGHRGSIIGREFLWLVESESGVDNKNMSFEGYHLHAKNT